MATTSLIDRMSRESDPNSIRLEALTAFQASEYTNALNCFDSLVASTDHFWDHRWRGLTLMCMGKYLEAYQTFEMLNTRCPEDEKSLPILALIKASCPDDAIRDGELALELAHAISDSRPAEYWSKASVLAAAYAEAADFDQALQYIDEAIRLAPSSVIGRFKQRRQQYVNHQPYRLPANGFDGFVPVGECQLCGAPAFCSDGFPGTARTVVCFNCAKQRFKDDRRGPQDSRGEVH